MDDVAGHGKDSDVRCLSESESPSALLPTSPWDCDNPQPPPAAGTITAAAAEGDCADTGSDEGTSKPLWESAQGPPPIFAVAASVASAETTAETDSDTLRRPPPAGDITDAAARWVGR